MAQYHNFQLFNYGLLREADDEDKKKGKPTKTQDKTKTPSLDIKDPDIGRAAPTTSKPTAEPAAQKTASAEKTRAKTSNLNIGPEGMRHMADLVRNMDQIDTSQENDVDADTGYEPEVPTTDNLPAVLQRGLMRGDEVQPEWHQVKNLPGYISKPIRAMGHQLFSMFTRTPIEKINVLADLSGQGPNEHQELNAVSAKLRERGRRLRQAEVSMRDLMPGYEAQINVFEADGYTFMLVKDFAGRYIYSWPSKDSISGGTAPADNAPTLAAPPRRLR